MSPSPVTGDSISYEIRATYIVIAQRSHPLSTGDSILLLVVRSNGSSAAMFMVSPVTGDSISYALQSAESVVAGLRLHPLSQRLSILLLVLLIVVVLTTFQFSIPCRGRGLDLLRLKKNIRKGWDWMVLSIPCHRGLNIYDIQDPEDHMKTEK